MNRYGPFFFFFFFFLFVDQDDTQAASGPERGRDRRAVPACAVHPDPLARQLVTRRGQLVQPGRSPPGDRAALRAPPRGGRRARRTSRWCRTWARSANVAGWNEPSVRRSSSAVPAAVASGRSMPMRTSSRCGLGRPRRSREQGQRRAPGDQPAQVGREAAVEAEVQVPGTWPAANAVRWRRSTTHSPAPIRAPQLGGRRPRRAGQVRRRPAGGVARRHVRVVGRPGAEPGQQLLDVGLLVLGQHRVGALLPADGRRRWPSDWVAEQKQPKPWVGKTPASSGSRSASRWAEACWCVHQLVGVLGPEQVGAAGRAVQQRAAGEHADALAGRRPREHVGQVGERVAGGGQRRSPASVHPTSTRLPSRSGCGRRTPRRRR